MENSSGLLASDRAVRNLTLVAKLIELLQADIKEISELSVARYGSAGAADTDAITPQPYSMTRDALVKLRVVEREMVTDDEVR